MPLDLGTEVKRHAADLLERRRWFHAHPELAFQEVQTSGMIADHLESWGYRVERGVATTGVLATLSGGREGRHVLVRADMDGLPLREDSSLPFKSTHDGVMHACGHDVHMAIALTAAQVLAAGREQLAGTVRFAFQPAEEVAGGARPMVEAGALEGIDRVVGLHVWAGLPSGSLSIRSGPMMASADWFTLRIEGKGGHGAEPHRGVDPVVIAAAVVTALQTLVSRETAPIAPVVLTLGTIRGGTAHNIIASDVTIEGTLRTFDSVLRQELLRRIEELAQGVAQAMRGRARFTLQSGAPPVVNNEQIARLVDEVARQVVGPQGVIPFEPLMVGEDVAYFLEQRPGCFFLLGGAPDGPAVVHHTADFRIDEGCLVVGLKVLTAAILRLAEP